MIYGYCKIGRAIALAQDGWGFVGGDNEPPRLLMTLALRRPEDRFIILSKCTDDPQACGFPPNVINAWTPARLDWFREHIRAVDEGDPDSMRRVRHMMGVMDAFYQPLAEKLDGMIVWAGQHGTANSILPAVTTGRSTHEGVTRPYDSFSIYAGGLLRLINTWRDPDPLNREEIILIADSRNYLKARDLKWPSRHPALGQFNMRRSTHHERYGDPTEPDAVPALRAKWKTDHTWSSTQDYVYSRLEVCGILPENSPIEFPDEFAARDLRAEWETRRHFGLFINEAGATGAHKRRDELPKWVLPLQPAFIHGKWTAKSLRELGVDIQPAPWDDYYPTLRSVRCTFTTPSSCSGWATTKPWEAFGSGVVCFFHPAYDTQDNILGDLPTEVRDWLRVQTPDDLRTRIEYLSRDVTAWEWLVRAQRELYDHACRELRHVQLIEQRMGGTA